MSITQTDLILHSAIKVALADLRRNKFLMKQAYAHLIEDPILKDKYGVKEAERLQKLLDKEINVYMAHKQNIHDAKFPCFVIKMGPGSEDSGKSSLNDYLEDEKVDSSTLGGAFAETKILAENLTPISYDNLTGEMHFSDDVNFDTLKVYEGHFVIDTKNNKKYPITLVVGTNTLMIDTDNTEGIDLTNIKITTGDLDLSHGKKTMWYWENHTIECWSSNSTECLYLWTILMYILSRYKFSLFDTRGFHLSSYNYGPIEPYNSEDPNVLYYKEVYIKGRVAHTFIESTNKTISAVDSGLKIDQATTPESLKDLLSNQIWSGARDDDSGDENQ